MIRDSVVKAFARAALSPDPDLAIAALMIARIEYPSLDAGPYLDELDAIGREARRRVTEARPGPVSAHDVPPHADPEALARVMVEGADAVLVDSVARDLADALRESLGS